MTSVEFPHPKDKLSLLKRIQAFSECSERQLVFIAERTRLVEYKKGEVIYQEGNKAEAFYIVVSGRLRVFTNLEQLEKTLTVLHNGDSFGEVSLLTGEAHSATVQAINDALVLQLSKSEFEELINRIPALVLHLSRLLSKRLRTKGSFGEYAEATVASIYSAGRGIGRTLFAVTLAAKLKEDTDRPLVIVDLNPDTPSQQRYYGAAARSAQRLVDVSGLLSEEELRQAVYEHPLGFSVLSVGALLASPDGEQAIAPLFSMLTKRYSYILVDLPVEMDARVLKSCTQSDLTFVLTDQHPDNVLRTKAVIRRIQEAVQPSEQRIKLVVNRLTGIAALVSLEDMAEQLGLPIAHVLPRASSETAPLTVEALRALLLSHQAPYGLAMRRVARELSGSLVGLALGSGAALGLAHIGVLKVLERERIPIDIIAGSSIGSLIAGLWASGVSADEMERMALRFKNPWDIRQLFILDLGIPLYTIVLGLVAGTLLAPLMARWWLGFLIGFAGCIPVGIVLGALAGGPIQGRQLMARLQRDFGGRTFDDTWLPLKIVAANPLSREEVIFESGSLAEAVRASVSIPGIFKPVLLQGQLCLDGGVMNPVPVSVLKRAGAHRVIAVNVFPTKAELAAHQQRMAQRRAEREAQLAARSVLVRFGEWVRQEVLRAFSPLIFDVIMRSMQSMEHQIGEVACHDADLTLRPTVPDSHWLEFFSPEKFIRRGEEAALEHLAQLKRLTGRERGVDNR